MQIGSCMVILCALPCRPLHVSSTSTQGDKSRGAVDHRRGMRCKKNKEEIGRGGTYSWKSAVIESGQGVVSDGNVAGTCRKGAVSGHDALKTTKRNGMETRG